jgi:cbb3-type cytochrome oxidase cytochrome c subunit
MPDLGLTVEEIATITQFIRTLLRDDRIVLPEGWRPSALERTEGRRLYDETYGCHGCHSIEGSGGYVGPPLDNAGDRIRPGWIFHWLLDPERLVPGTAGPRTGMSPEEALAITSFLMRL